MNLTAAPKTPVLTRTPPRDAQLLQAGAGLWRVVDRSGRALGHLRASPCPDGVRFCARRFHAATRTFHELGEFWSADDAVDCLRLSR